MLLLPTSPRRGVGPVYYVEKLWRGLQVLMGLLRQSGRHCAVVIGLDGDAGIWLNLIQAHLARRLGRRLFFYHHSARCLAGLTPAIRVLTGHQFSDATHVMCSAVMSTRFRELYAWRGRSLVVGNLAYVATPPQARPRSIWSGMLTPGFLSSMMRSKGVLLAVDALRRLLQLGVDAQLLLAGPLVEAAIEDELRSAEREFRGRLILLGRIDGAAKERFFATIDVFLFRLSVSMRRSR